MTKRIYTEEEKAGILEEVKAVGCISTVSKTRDIPTTTIHTWLKKDKTSSGKEYNLEEKCKKLQKKLSNIELENKILKDLVKKTVQLWDTG